MLHVITTFRRLPFGALMKVYEKTNLEQGREQWPWETPERQLALAQEAFCDYLQRCFFRIPGAAYCLWLVEDQPVSALRYEPYGHGVLITALETAPDSTGKGYATELLKQTLEHLREEGIRKVCVHIHRGNRASIRVHKRCGFTQITRGAKLLDGSYRSDFDTFGIDLE